MWLHKGTTIDKAPEEYQGFVYVITNKANGKKYIGKKNFWTVKKLPPLKGKVNKRHRKTETDWQLYYGSNEQIKLLLEEHGPTRWNRTILRLCKSKGEMSYYEAKLQFDKNVLFDPNYYNEFIGLKIHSKHVANLIEEMMNGRD